MMERYKGYWISGSAPGPPHTHYWESSGSILKDGHLSSVVEVVRIQEPGITFDFDVRGFAEFYGMEISRIAVDHLFIAPRVIWAAAERDESIKVLIVYYSTYGNVYRMATLVAERGERDSGRPASGPYRARTHPEVRD